MVLLVAATPVPGFTRPFSISTGLATFAPAALMALPLALLVIVRDIDISVAASPDSPPSPRGLAIEAGQSVPVVIVAAW